MIYWTLIYQKVIISTSKFISSLENAIYKNSKKKISRYALGYDIYLLIDG